MKSKKELTTELVLPRRNLISTESWGLGSGAKQRGQAFQPGGSPDFPVRPRATGNSPQTGRQKCLPHASRPATSPANFEIQAWSKHIKWHRTQLSAFGSAIQIQRKHGLGMWCFGEWATRV